MLSLLTFAQLPTYAWYTPSSNTPSSTNRSVTVGDDEKVSTLEEENTVMDDAYEDFVPGRTTEELETPKKKKRRRKPKMSGYTSSSTSYIPSSTDRSVTVGDDEKVPTLEEEKTVMDDVYEDFVQNAYEDMTAFDAQLARQLQTEELRQAVDARLYAVLLGQVTEDKRS